LSVFFKKERSKLESINDINSELINLWEQIKNNPQTLSFYLNQLFVSRVIFNNIRLKKYIPKNYLISQSF
jgi:DNA adenine methylase